LTKLDQEYGDVIKKLLEIIGGKKDPLSMAVQKALDDPKNDAIVRKIG